MLNSRKIVAGHLTKADEKALFAEIVEGCPEGYVKDILESIHLDVNRAIDSDFGFVDFADHMRAMEACRKSIAEARAELHKAQEAVKELERTAYQLTTGIGSIRADIRKLATL
jgi:septal ring factor EnvC (AmiA/AmiB activator)